MPCNSSYTIIYGGIVLGNLEDLGIYLGTTKQEYEENKNEPIYDEFLCYEDMCENILNYVLDWEGNTRNINGVSFYAKKYPYKDAHGICFGVNITFSPTTNSEISCNKISCDAISFNEIQQAKKTFDIKIEKLRQSNCELAKILQKTEAIHIIRTDCSCCY
jgi:hypothetical protein